MNENNETPEQRAARIATQQANINARLPPDALELLQDPRLDTLKPAPKGMPATLVIKPAEPVRTEGAYLRLEEGFTSRPSHNAEWVNKPDRIYFGGDNFDSLNERPRIEQARKAPRQLFHLARFGQFFVASPDVLELIQRVDPEAIACVAIDWVFSDGQALDGYVFLDIVRRRQVYDFKRSTVNVEVREGVRWPAFGYDRALRDDIPADVHLVRDAHYRHESFVSRVFAEQIYQLAHRELDFQDVHTHQRVEFARSRTRRKLLARLKPAEVVEENASMPLRRRMKLRIMPLLQNGAFAEAESTLVRWLADEPASPYHVIADLQITNDPRDCAQFFDAFYEHACKAGRVGAVYTEMNGFTINPDLWFCDAFAFRSHGGTDSFDWLGDFDASTDQHFAIDGLEDLQRVFLTEMESRPDRQQHANARQLAESLVIVKFQRLLQSARPHMQKLRCPLLASAHDYGQFVVEVVT